MAAPTRPDAPGPESLVDPFADLEPLWVVVPDEPVRGVQQLLRGSEVVGQDDPPGLRVGRSEAEDVGQRGPAETIDALVVITHHHHVARRRGGQPLDQLELGVVRVLELVDQDVLVSVLLGLGDVRVLAQDLEGEAHLVSEVDPIGGAQECRVGPVRGRQLGLACRLLGQGLVVRMSGGLGRQVRRCRAVGVGRDVFVLRAGEMGRQRRQETSGIAQRAESVQGKLVEVLAQEGDLLGARQDGHLVRQAHGQPVLADEPITEGVERADDRIGETVRDELIDPLLHLGRGPLGEGQGQDLRGPGLLLRDEPRDAAGEDRGLTGTRPGDHQERPVPPGHGLALAWRQVCEERGLDTEMATTGWRGCRLQLLEDGDLVRRRDDRGHGFDGSRGIDHGGSMAGSRDRLSVASE